jgi:hypothetical protein
MMTFGSGITRRDEGGTTMTRSKGVLAMLGVVGALIGAGAAYSSQSAGGPPDDPFVAGGGRFGPGCFDLNQSFCFALPRDLSVDAHLEKDGTKVTGVVYYGNNDGVQRVRVDVTCLAVVGNRAAIGGIVRDHSSPEFVGFGALLFLRDVGQPGRPSRDRSSPLFVDTLTSPDWPAGFPYTCPGPDSTINNIGFQVIHSGDVIVFAGTD